MINFRFHLVSLVAVFLALGLGILVGSTVVDQKIVDRLDSDIARVRHENADRRDANKKLSQENAQLRQFLDDVAPYAGDGRLDPVSVAVVAEAGVNGDDVKDTAQALQAAGAEVPGVVWLQDSWRLDSDKRVPGAADRARSRRQRRDDARRRAPAARGAPRADTGHEDDDADECPASWVDVDDPPGKPEPGCAQRAGAGRLRPHHRR